MRVKELLRNLTTDDIDCILAERVPGVGIKNTEKEMLKIFGAIPVIKSLMGKAVTEHQRDNFGAARRYRMIINTLVLIYKKEQNAFIDKILADPDLSAPVSENDRNKKQDSSKEDTTEKNQQPEK